MAVKACKSARVQAPHTPEALNAIAGENGAPIADNISRARDAIIVDPSRDREPRVAGSTVECAAGCRCLLEALSRFAPARAAAGPPAIDEGDTPRDGISATLPSIPLRRTNSRAGTVACRDSVRDLLRFYGHAPLLHVEGVVWVKSTGARGGRLRRMLRSRRTGSQRTLERRGRTFALIIYLLSCAARPCNMANTNQPLLQLLSYTFPTYLARPYMLRPVTALGYLAVQCVTAVSNSAFFLVPLRGPSCVSGVVRGFSRSIHSNTSLRIIEIPLGFVIDVGMVSARENLKTFADFEANWTSKPFRIVTTGCHREVTTAQPGRIVADAERRMTFVGFETVCLLRHVLVFARQSWATRAATEGSLAVRLASSPTAAAESYLKGVHEAITGVFRNQVDAQCELMEALADEMVLDPALKQAFFSTGNIFFEIARRLEDTNVASGTDHDTKNENPESGRSQKELRREANGDARWLCAAAAVLDSAFFHSLGTHKGLDLVARSAPLSVPVAGDMLLAMFCDVHDRVAKYGANRDSAHGKGGTDGDTESDEDEEGDGSVGSTGHAQELLVRALDVVVRAVNGMSDAIVLSNVEQERLGAVRNLVAMGLGRAWRRGCQPAASQALKLLTMVNERAVELVETVHRQELDRREAERALRKPVLKAAPREAARWRERLFSRPAFCLAGLRLQSPPPRNARDCSAATSPASARSSASRGRARSIDGVLPRRATGSDDEVEDDCTAGPLAASEPGRDRSIRAPSGMSGGQALEHGRGHAATAAASEDRWTKTAPRPGSSPRSFLSTAPVLLHAYTKLLHALVCGSYNLRAAFLTSCEADLRNIAREGGYLDMLDGVDGGAPRILYREAATFLHDILVECTI